MLPLPGFLAGLVTALFSRTLVFLGSSIAMAVHVSLPYAHDSVVYPCLPCLELFFIVIVQVLTAADCFSIWYRRLTNLWSQTLARNIGLVPSWLTEPLVHVYFRSDVLTGSICSFVARWLCSFYPVTYLDKALQWIG